jgi:tRNA-modifying protein YgfZ
MQDILDSMTSIDTGATTGAGAGAKTGVAAGAASGEPSGEYDVLTRACGLLDRSQRGKLALSGPDAVEFLNGQVTNELAGLRAGEGCYAAFLTHKGKMLGDLRVLAVGDRPAGAPSELLLDTERVALRALFDMILRFKVGYRVELHKRTLERSLFSLIGPASGAVVESPGEEEHANRPARIAGRPVLLARTAEPAGIDVFCDVVDGEAVRAALLRTGASPVGEATAEILRVEHGRPRYGIDLDDTVIPQEAGLNERAVSFTKGCYLGQETVARLYYKGKPNRRLRGLRLSEPLAPGAELRLSERPVGVLGSSVVSPVLGPIGLALVRREAEPGVTVAADGARATVQELPFRDS